jgi:tRNA (guanine37-N1)-methyltransferase
MRFDIITLFPEMFVALNYGIVGRAINNNLVTINLINPRDYSQNKHKRVDERPYGGGPGMVMMVEPLSAAIKDVKKNSNAKSILLTPQGTPLNQNAVNSLIKNEHLILIAGRYEGVDERLITNYIDEEWSIGDYVLSGGEFAAMVLMDAMVRLLPNALGDDENVPNVLLSGNHKEIAKWRLQQKLGRTFMRRPDLLKQYKLTTKEKELLASFLKDVSRN